MLLFDHEVFKATAPSQQFLVICLSRMPLDCGVEVGLANVPHSCISFNSPRQIACADMPIVACSVAFHAIRLFPFEFLRCAAASCLVTEFGIRQPTPSMTSILSVPISRPHAAESFVIYTVPLFQRGLCQLGGEAGRAFPVSKMASLLPFIISTCLAAIQVPSLFSVCHFVSCKLVTLHTLAQEEPCLDASFDAVNLLSMILVNRRPRHRLGPVSLHLERYTPFLSSVLFCTEGGLQNTDIQSVGYSTHQAGNGHYFAFGFTDRFAILIGDENSPYAMPQCSCGAGLQQCRVSRRFPCHVTFSICSKLDRALRPRIIWGRHLIFSLFFVGDEDDGKRDVKSNMPLQTD